MLLKVLTLSGEEHEIEVQPSETVVQIKEKLEERDGIPVVQQRLIFQGKQLNDEKTIKSYKMQAGTVLHLVVALRGG